MLYQTQRGSTKMHRMGKNRLPKDALEVTNITLYKSYKQTKNKSTIFSHDWLSRQKIEVLPDRKILAGK